MSIEIAPTAEDWEPYYQGTTPPTPPQIPTPAGMVRVSSAAFHAAIGPLERLEIAIVGRYDTSIGYRTEFTQDRRLIAVSLGGTHLCPRIRFLAEWLVKREITA